ncbi:DNA adenine methylase [Leadbettera azotonutricia]|uniref:site-specific DNA-methyltransferase (adenine-specific) n=1 Tax=Leadbettera azotonutricia (strain ATCC BAA-888 / DSM 13862 / ZAS-9) TaxID=545695 RepID=F5YGC2_LEAAZ|nr:DNA adenine methylase [Leadbettera azotonutricia]AEF81357.1 retron EC67 DNA adenine methylase [Leadbettera azotonutricia ZAS-9]
MAGKNLPIKPYLKWAGGKRQLLSEIKKHLPQNINSLTYYEPFVGAGAVLFDLQPQKAVINDFNTELILTYRVIKDHIEELIQELQIHKEKTNEAYYYEIRATDRDKTEFNTLSEIKRAARLIYLNKTCYNGLYRVNSQGLFNVPYGRYKNPAICEEPVLRAVHNYLAANEITITSGDFEDAVKNINKESFVYFDPPYHSPDKTNFTGYQADGFNEDEQIRLRDTFLNLTKQGIQCLLSNSDTPFIRELYQNPSFEIIAVLAKRTINSDADGRGKVNEVLIKNRSNT